MTNTTRTVEHYFGGCPECGGNDGYMNVRWYPDQGAPDNVCVCDAHRTAWVIGANLFTLDPEFDTDQRMLANGDKLKGYRSVDPLPMDAPIPRPRPILTLVPR